jgi:anti-sigma factor RsiW
MMTTFEPTEADIAGYVDDRLDDARRRLVERWLADHPDRTPEIERQREFNAALRGLGAEILDEPVPDRLRQVLTRSLEASDIVDQKPRTIAHDGVPRRRSWSLGGLASACALVLIGLAIGWVARSALEARPSDFDTVLADASYAFSFYSRDKVHAIQFPPDQVAAFTDASSALFERKMGPPDLAEAGLKFRGARIAPVGRQISTFFFFEDSEGKNLGVVFWPQDEQGLSEAGFRELDEIAARFWFSEGLGFAVLGSGDQASLSEIGDKVVAFYGENDGD